MKRSAWFLVGALLAALIGFSRPMAANAGMSTSPVPSLRFEVLARAGLQLGGLVWTGSRFVYTVEGQPQIYASTPDGKNVRPFARVPRNSGEMRCIVSPVAVGGPLTCYIATLRTGRSTGLPTAAVPRPRSPRSRRRGQRTARLPSIPSGASAARCWRRRLRDHAGREGSARRPVRRTRRR